MTSAPQTNVRTRDARGADLDKERTLEALADEGPLQELSEELSPGERNYRMRAAADSRQIRLRMLEPRRGRPTRAPRSMSERRF